MDGDNLISINNYLSITDGDNSKKKIAQNSFVLFKTKLS